MVRGRGRRRRAFQRCGRTEVRISSERRNVRVAVAKTEVRRQAPGEWAPLFGWKRIPFLDGMRHGEKCLARLRGGGAAGRPGAGAARFSSPCRRGARPGPQAGTGIAPGWPRIVASPLRRRHRPSIRTCVRSGSRSPPGQKIPSRAGHAREPEKRGEKGNTSHKKSNLPRPQNARPSFDPITFRRPFLIDSSRVSPALPHLGCLDVLRSVGSVAGPSFE